LTASLLLAVLFLLGVATGGLSNVTSGGAGIFTIFFLTQYLGLSIQDSTGTVLAASTIIVLIGAVSFFRQGRVNSQLAITVGVSGVGAAFVAARWAASIDSNTLKQVFGVFTFALALYMVARLYLDLRAEKIKRASPTAVPTEPLGPSRWMGTDPLALSVQVLKGVFIGFATGLFGVGLASLSIVLFMLLFRLDLKTILGTSLFASFMRYLGGSVGYLSTGLIDPTYFLVIVAGGAIGSLVGARVILKNERGSMDTYVKLLVIAVLLFVSYEFLLKKVGA